MARPSKSPDEKRLTGASKRKAPHKPSSGGARRVATKVRAPAWISKPARAIWYRIVPELARLNLISQGDADVIGRYCADLASWIKAQRILDREGLTVLVPMTNSDHKMPRRHPAVQVCSDLHRRMVDIEDRFGGSPLARYRLFAQQAAHPNLPGDLFAGAASAKDDAVTAPAPASPIGALNRPTLN